MDFSPSRRGQAAFKYERSFSPPSPLARDRKSQDPFLSTGRNCGCSPAPPPFPFSPLFRKEKRESSIVKFFFLLLLFHSFLPLSQPVSPSFSLADRLIKTEDLSSFLVPAQRDMERLSGISPFFFFFQEIDAGGRGISLSLSLADNIELPSSPPSRSGRPDGESLTPPSSLRGSRR